MLISLKEFSTLTILILNKNLQLWLEIILILKMQENN
jgi:hypothetical protein